MKIKNIHSWSTEKISQRVLYSLIGLSLVVFVMFFLIGYDLPFDENPDFNAPLFTDLLIALMWILLALSIGLVVFSVIRGYRNADRENISLNLIPEKKIFRITWGVTFMLLVLTFLLGSSATITVNGSKFADWIWLKTSDMFVNTSIVMLLGAFASVLFGATRYIRKVKK